MPILEFHVIARPSPAAPFAELYDPPATFRAQLRWLAGHGYRTVTLDELVRAWHGEGRLPARPVVLTFDDGYPQDVTTVLDRRPRPRVVVIDGTIGHVRRGQQEGPAGAEGPGNGGQVGSPRLVAARVAVVL